MASIEMVMPQMGESIMEGTIIGWLKQEGDTIEQDESVLEVGTDKVDQEIPATYDGVLEKILAKEGEVVPVGQPIAVISVKGEVDGEDIDPDDDDDGEEPVAIAESSNGKGATVAQVSAETQQDINQGRFYSPLVRNIAKEENISGQELAGIKGSGKEGRVTKKDILNYLENRNQAPQTTQPSEQPEQSENGYSPAKPRAEPSSAASTVPVSGSDEIVKMDRMRKMIANRMLDSQKIAAHVSSFVEVDVTNMVAWRNKHKNAFQQREGEKFTFTPIFVQAVARAIREYPMINVSVDGDNIIKHKNINIGIAVALPNNNLIVPVVKNADQLSLVGLARQVNGLTQRARNNQLTTDDLSGGTYTISNIGTFGNILGTPIIMQPQVAILAIGSIEKKPAVIETPAGDAIAIRHKMYLSHSYDHRTVDGYFGGTFVKRVGDLLENFDLEQTL